MTHHQNSPTIEMMNKELSKAKEEVASLKMIDSIFAKPDTVIMQVRKPQRFEAKK
jgi:hypothetical protein